MLTLNQLADAALSLPRDQRAVLAAILEDSLDEEDLAEVSAAWDAEIQRRLSAIDRGEATLLTEEEVNRRLEAKYGPLLDT